MYEAVECHEYLELPALTIGVDGDGAGRTVILELEEMGIPVERIHWGLPYRIDERGRYQMTPADKVKSDGIKSPDISDTVSLFFSTTSPPEMGRRPRWSVTGSWSWLGRAWGNNFLAYLFNQN